MNLVDRRTLGLCIVDSTRTAIAATTAYLIARISGLPEAYWAAIMTFIIMQSKLGAALKISGERFVGTVLGAICGGLLARYLPQSVWAFAVGVFLLGIVSSLLHVQYAYRFAGITLTIVFLIPRAAPVWIIAWHRFVEVSVGIVVGLAITGIWPEKEQPGG